MCCPLKPNPSVKGASAGLFSPSGRKLESNVGPL